MDDKVYIPIEISLGEDGEDLIFAETNEADGNWDELISDILGGYAPYKVIAVEPHENDVSRLVAQEVIARAWDMDIEITAEVRDFCEGQGVPVPADVRVSGEVK